MKKNTLRLVGAVYEDFLGVRRIATKWVGSNPSGPAGGGQRERSRRRRQILSGQLAKDNGFIGGLDAIALARQQSILLGV